MRLILTRDTYLTSCTLGSLYVPGAPLFQTIERPWIESDSCRGGTPLISCVPEGVYQLVRHNSVKHPKTWALDNSALDICADPTPGARDDCLIHPANWAHELEGCIAPGTARLLSNNEWMVLSSVTAFQLIQKLVPWTNDHILEIQKKP